MKRIILFAMALGLAAACSGRAAEPQQPVVYMTTEITPEALVRIYEALDRPAEGRVAVKISTGEPGGHNFLQPSLIKDLVQKVDGTIVECNTAYGGRRSNTEDHIQAAREHGFFDIADVDIMDSEGEFRIPVRDTTHIKYDIVGTHLRNYDFMINLAHFKGHAMAGFGGVIKNQSIVLESMASAAQGVADYFGENILYINVMNNLSVDCDCDAHPADPLMLDVGIFASLDPVALDEACLDYVYGMTPSEGNDNRPLMERIDSRNGRHTVEYAEQIGLGSREYTLVNIDE